MLRIRKNNQQRDDNSFFPRWKRQIHYAWQNVYNDFRQHAIASLLTIIVIAISITLPTIGYLLWKNANQAAHQWYPTPNLTVYINKTLNQKDTDNLIKQITQFPEVERVNYLSRDETLQEFKLWSGFSEALELLDENPLPAVAIIMPKDEAKQTAILHAIQTEIVKLKGVDDVRLDDSWFTRLTTFTDMVKTIVWTISIFMMIAVALVIGNSIRLAIFSRRQTIIVMQLIGATDGFILRPFLYSGMFNGFISAILALILSEIFIFRIDAIILNVSSVFGTIFNLEGLNWDESLFIILIATMIGWLSALLATKKYLNMPHIN
ncbi:cell division protein FtsX [Frischella sp. Ac48]|uniref:Cell division protein FtsX n=1 Tax=Frischella japonica TaxID=2741544 RepID=A0ABR7R084_9GAMM|nr:MULTISPECIES: permease-like cell division protein FtsX [Frischella]MBC9131860.1 cell division protein FtsX [Frischella japonica]MBX4132613.1 cell division protein FtsX [Frischella sp. Ac48]